MNAADLERWLEGIRKYQQIAYHRRIERAGGSENDALGEAKSRLAKIQVDMDSLALTLSRSASTALTAGSAIPTSGSSGSTNHTAGGGSGASVRKKSTSAAAPRTLPTCFFGRFDAERTPFAASDAAMLSNMQDIYNELSVCFRLLQSHAKSAEADDRLGRRSAPVHPAVAGVRGKHRRTNSLLSVSSSVFSDEQFFDAPEMILDDEEQTGSMHRMEDEEESEEDVVVEDDSDEDALTDGEEAGSTSEPSSRSVTPPTSRLAASVKSAPASPRGSAAAIPLPPPEAVAAGSLAHSVSQMFVVRRSRLPAPPVTSDLNLFSLLRKNMGKDLSRVSMPVTLNEPLSMLQHLCEELEYSELLDTASKQSIVEDRLTYVAAFAVSAYARTLNRPSRKPFNPLLGETYECVRPDKGFRFISEKVCHHPAIIASHCESESFTLFQDMRPKSKFWGKSMEVTNDGTVHLVLKINGGGSETYTWNKVVTCMRNIFSDGKYLEHYGDMIVKNHTTGYTCKMEFKETGYFSSNMNEVSGTLTNARFVPFYAFMFPQLTPASLAASGFGP
mgnify:CR=1 FL=1